MRIHDRQSPRKGGFSLAELMVVIVIIGLLVTMVAKNVMRNLSTAQRATAMADIAMLIGACDDYAIDHAGRYPESLEELVTPDERGQAILKQESVPKDPWGNEYLYEPPGSGEVKPIVYSTGRDGALGGEGDDEDISSRDLYSQR